MSSDCVITIENVSKVYRSFSKPSLRLLQLMPWNKGRKLYTEFTALESVNLQLERGQVLGLVGQNGAGKSTLLQLICNTLEPSQGKISVNGKIAALLELGSGFNPEFTGRENIFLSGAIAGMTREEVAAKFDEIVDFSGVQAFIDHPVKTYSSGMMVRLAFAVATSIDPDILVIDEALSVGDGAFARKSFDRIMQLKASGCTIIFCSHSLYQVEVLCNRVIWLDRGKIRAEGEPGSVVSSYQNFLDQVGLDKPQETAQSDSRAFLPGNSRITGVRAFTENGSEQDLQLVTDRDSLSIEVSYLVDQNLPKPTLGIVITDDQLRNITSAGSFYDQHELAVGSDGHGKALLTFPKLGLRKGKYIVHVFLLCENALHIYEAVQCCTFTVTQKGSELGVVSLPRHWD